MLVDQFDIPLELERTLAERDDEARELEMLQQHQALPPGSVVSSPPAGCRSASAMPSGARATSCRTTLAILLPDDLMLCDVSCMKRLQRRLRGDRRQCRGDRGRCRASRSPATA